MSMRVLIKSTCLTVLKLYVKVTKTENYLNYVIIRSVGNQMFDTLSWFEIVIR